MRAAAILGLGCSVRDLKPFQADRAANGKAIDWRIGLRSDPSQADIILVFGGDGTIHRHLSQLVELGLPVLVVPVGSGNDFARALGLRNIRDSLAAWQRFCTSQHQEVNNTRLIDLGTITPQNSNVSEAHSFSRSSALGAKHYFCSVAGIGLDSKVACRANQLPRWLRGHGGYALSLVLSLFRFAPLLMKISAEDKNGEWRVRSDQPTVLAAFANSGIYGGGMKIAPRARMDDGQLDTCVIAGIDAFKLARMFPTVYFGRHVGLREVNYFRGARLHVETETPLDVYADGEFVCRTPIEITVEPGVLRVVAKT
jgi:diacylglycerol kinase (ATP)